MGQHALSLSGLDQGPKDRKGQYISHAQSMAHAVYEQKIPVMLQAGVRMASAWLMSG